MVPFSESSSSTEENILARSPSATGPLPIIPAALLKRHQVQEANDNRFKACARLLQALWRERHELPVGAFHSFKGRRRIGSLISPAAAEAGRNFLSPDIARVARRAVVYQESGAMIDRGRLFSNLLSSMPLAFNVFGPLALDLGLATKVMKRLMPGADIRRVTRILFEHSPGRLDVRLTGDRTAFDVAVHYERRDGAAGFIGIEMKYAENMSDSAAGGDFARYGELANASGLFKNPASAVLRLCPLEQLFREHLLTQATLARGEFAEATFMVIGPRHNHLVQRAANLYAAHLVDPEPGKNARFINVELEAAITVLDALGERDHATALYQRYCDWRQVHIAVEQALSAEEAKWTTTPKVAPPLALIGKAA
jgi:hypothetical protein